MDSATSSSSTLSGVLLPQRNTVAFPAPPSGLPQPLQPTRTKNSQPGITVRIPSGQSQTDTLGRSRMVICERASRQPPEHTITLNLLIDLYFLPNFIAKHPDWRWYHGRTRARMEIHKSLKLGASRLLLQVESWRQNIPPGPDPELTSERHEVGFDREGRSVFDWDIHRAALAKRRDEFKTDLTNFVNELDQGEQIQNFIDGYLSITPRIYTDRYRAPPVDDVDRFPTESVEGLDAIPDI
ncbi:MAG: hypothetical protein Q9184_000384 [Pyrenodesmia sp. 2 TL-2023]